MFYVETKGELAHMMPDSGCCVISELSAIARSCGRLEKRQNNCESSSVFEIRTKSAASARKIMGLVRSVFKCKPKVRFTHYRSGLPGNQYIIEMTYNTNTFKTLQDLGVVSQKTDGISLSDGVPWHLLSRQCCLRAYLRGMFLARGYVQNPEKEYHMEFMTDSSAHAAGIIRVAESFNVTPRVSVRKKGYMVYVKGGDDVAQLLRVMGAHSAVLTLESIRVLRGVRGDVNRVVNCETANVMKAVDAGLAQITAIRKIDEIIGLGSLPRGFDKLPGLG